jgi:hypothetical protein
MSKFAADYRLFKMFLTGAQNPGAERFDPGTE